VAVGGAFGKTTLYFALAMAVVFNVGAYFFSDKLVLAMHRARELDLASAPRLHAIVAELATRAGIPKPRVFLIMSAQPNAFATGRNPQHAVVAVTQGILEMLSERELRAVLAHELGHVKNRDILVATIAATIAAAVSYLAQVLQFSFLFGGSHSRDDEGGSPIAALLTVLFAPIAATLIQLGISRSREYLADEQGAQLSGDPRALASALQKLEYGAHHIPADVQPATSSLFIVNPLSGRAGTLLRLFSTHPSTEERVKRLLAMPSADGASRAHTRSGPGRFIDQLG
jgi:heat shock protein HtpX